VRNSFKNNPSPVLFLGLFLFSGPMACSSDKAKVAPEPLVIKSVSVVSQPAPEPEGVEPYCWEEPLVVREKVRAGLEFKGHYYRPAHNTLRKVRQGRWVPCRQQKGLNEKRTL